MYNQNNQDFQLDYLTSQEQEQFKQAQALQDLKQTQGWQILQSHLINLPKFPNPSDYKSHESLLIEYYKQYGIAEAVRSINTLMNQQEAIIKNFITRNEQQREGF